MDINNWKELRQKYFKECTQKDSVDGTKFRIDIAPHDLFEWFKNNLAALQPSTLPLIETKDLQEQVREHINSHDLFDWHEALTGNEMTYLENLLLTFNPLCPPGSIGFEEQKRHIQSIPLIDKGEQSEKCNHKWITVCDKCGKSKPVNF